MECDDQKALEVLLEDPTSEDAMVTSWRVVKDASTRISKRVQRKSKNIPQ